MKGSLKGLVACMAVLSLQATAQNPIVRDQFSADPTARAFGGKIYVYPSHDIPTPAEKPGRKDWFCMEDYHVFSSENLIDWTDHGMIVNQKQVPWVDATTYSMWAPDCVEKGGKYYFFFPANVKRDSSSRGGFGIGVGISDRPEGPFSFQDKPIAGVHGIDPSVLIDPKDGKAYIYYAQGNLFMARLKDNLTELDSEPVVIEGLPKGFKEGPFVFERAGKYYLTYPYVKNKTESLVYSVSDNPMGPFTYGGVIMDESPTGCWTNHQSVVQYKDQWYLFYHHNDYSPKFDKNRSIRADSLFFEADGSIRKVVPTWRGIGLTEASSKIQLDRYSALSKEGVTLAFLDSARTFDGWKLCFSKPGAWCRYNAVKFATKAPVNLLAKIASAKGATVELRLDRPEGPVMASMKVGAGSGWQEVLAKIRPIVPGRHDLFLTLLKGEAEIDWISFR